MAKKSYTILILSDASTRFRRIFIPRSLPTVALVLVSAIVFSFIYLMADYLVLKKEYNRIQVLRGETQAQTSKIAELRTQVQEIEEAVTRLSEFSTKLRNIIAPETPGRAAKKAVRESRGPGVEVQEAAFARDKQSLLETLQGEVALLSAKTISQEKNLWDLAEFFSRRKDIIASTPSVWPARGWVSSGYGYRTSPFTGRRQFHQGIDIATGFREKVRATAAGVVTYVGPKEGLGNLVEIDHRNGFTTRYAHNFRILVRRGQLVDRGEIISETGDSGLTTGPHLHYEVLRNGVAVDPLRHILDEVAYARMRPQG